MLIILKVLVYPVVPIYLGNLHTVHTVLCPKERAKFNLSAAFSFTKVGAAVPKLGSIKGENPAQLS